MGKYTKSPEKPVTDKILLLMEEILHQLICGLSYYLQGFSTIPGGFLHRRISGCHQQYGKVFFSPVFGPGDRINFVAFVASSHWHGPMAFCWAPRHIGAPPAVEISVKDFLKVCYPDFENAMVS